MKSCQGSALPWLFVVQLFNPSTRFTQWKMNEAAEVSLFCQCHRLDSVLLELSGIMLNKPGLQKANPLIYWKLTGLCVGVVNAITGTNVISHYWEMLPICNATINRHIDICAHSAGSWHLIGPLKSSNNILYSFHNVDWFPKLKPMMYTYVVEHVFFHRSSYRSWRWLYCEQLCYKNNF